MANIFNSMTYYDISGVCIQRSRKALLIPPPQRLELQKSPYVGAGAHSQYELDMRRKAEILKYDKGGDKVNRLTKAEQFAQLANGSSQRRNYSNQLLQGIIDGVLSCETLNSGVPTMSSSCDIPGPEFEIVLDPTVPLYNYVTNTDAYSLLPVEDTRQYITYIQTDVLVSSIAPPNELFLLYIDNKIEKPLTTFQFTVPFTISTYPSTYPSSIVYLNPYVYAYYNSTLIATNDKNSLFVKGVSPLMKTVPAVTVTYTKTSSGFFTGVLRVDGLSLYTSPGYVLDIKVIFDLAFNLGITWQVICNPAGSAGLQITGY